MSGVQGRDPIQAAVSTRMGDLFQESITLFGLLAIVFIMNTELAILTLIVAPVIVTPVVQFGKRLRGTTHRSQERMADIATLLEETIRGVRIVKAFTMERFEIRRFHEATKRHLGANLKAQKIQALTSPVMELLAGLCMILLFLYAHRRIQNGTLTLGEFVSFLGALAMMYAPIKKLNKVNLSVNAALSGWTGCGLSTTARSCRSGESASRLPVGHGGWSPDSSGPTRTMTICPPNGAVRTGVWARKRSTRAGSASCGATTVPRQ